MHFDLKGKVAVVTGGSRGIGRAIAQGLLSCGARVLITSTHDTSGWWKQETTVTHAVLNFNNDASIEAFSRTLDQFDRIDILVNNAGIHYPMAIDRIKQSQWEEVLRVNLTGPMRMIQLVLPKMKEHGGSILNVSSISGIIARPGGGTYSASKSGLIGLTRAVALDLAKHRILVNALCPGTTRTDMVDQVLSQEQTEQFRRQSALERLATPEEIANIALFLVSPLNTYITGQAIVADGGTIIQ